MKSLHTLNKTHQLVHVHANNAGVALSFNGWVLPDLLEVTYVNKSKYETKDSDRYFPTSLDSRNIVEYPEVMLGFWN